MFDWFRNYRKPEGSIAEDMNKVIPFPDTKTVPSMPEVNPPKEKPATVFYRFGITDKNRLAFQMGYSEITMNKAGVQNLIDHLEYFKSQLEDEYDES